MNDFELIACADSDEMASMVVDAWLEAVESANRVDRPFTVALSGGRIAQKLFSLAAREAGARGISFGRVHFFWADERCVSPGSPDSNFKTAQDLLFGPLKIRDDHIHRIRGEDQPAAAAAAAEKELCRIATAGKDGRPVLDLIFLGMGEDGHVASLFPGRMDGMGRVIFCAIKDSPKPPPDRVTLSYASIVAAVEVWVLASGTGKEKALRQSLSPTGETPLGRVIQSRSGTKIFADIAVSP
jgi:6-phosphogluconolactonase